MASLAGFTSASLSELLGQEVNDATVLVAKNMILGSSAAAVAQILSCTESEVQELIDSDVYKACHLVMAAQYNHDTIETDLGYDEIEQIALQKLKKSLDREKNPDVLVRVLSMANRAVRRQAVAKNSDALNPGNAGTVVHLSLSRRLIEKLDGSAGAEREVHEQISISGGAKMPGFDDVMSMLEGKPRTHANQMHRPEQPEVTLEAVQRLLEG